MRKYSLKISMCPLQLPKITMMILIAVVFLGRYAFASRYIPKSWAGMCHKNFSVSPTPGGVRPAILVDLQCFILKSQQVQWKLNDLRAWTIDKDINYQTTPTNRTVTYNITVTCEPGANISLPWPMRVAGLLEVHIKYCYLLDRYSNFMDEIDSTIDNDLRILEIRHSFWILNETNQIMLNSGTTLNLTSEFDCGQDSTLEAVVTSNVSDILADDISVITKSQVKNTNGGNNIGDVKAVSAEPAADSSSGWPAKPEDQLIKDAAKVVSDSTNLRRVELDNGTLKDSPKQKNLKTESKDLQTEQESYIKLMQQILLTRTKCNFKKLKSIDESITPTTPLHHFDLMVYGAEYPVLEKMNYSHTGLREVPKQLTEWRIYFSKLTRVDLTYNYVSEIKIPSYPSTSGADMVIFDLRFNNITTINLDVLKSWAADVGFFVDIRNNPIHCGCDLSPMLPYLVDGSTFEGNLARYEYVKYLQCHTPEELRGEQLYKLTPDALQCQIFVANNSIVIALGVLLCLLIIVVIVIIRFKVEIRILLYTRLHVRLPCDAEIQRNNKTFDAFISYSNEDAAWVRKHLVNFLENVPNGEPYLVNKTSNHSNSSFKLCIHQRDFIPGKTIFDNIVDCIEASRHTIIVMSPSFTRSHWAMEELRQAYRQSLAEKTRYLIIILLEKVSKEEMDPLMRRCCKTFTYLDVNDHLFKDRLVFSLTTKSRNAGITDRSTTRENKQPKGTSQKEANVHTKVATTHTYDNVAYFNKDNSNRPSEPIRELSNMSTASTIALTSFWQGKTY